MALRSDRLVLLFARMPRDERRAKPLVDGAAARSIEALHERLLRRALAVACAAGVHTRLVTTGDAAIARDTTDRPDVEVVAQVGATFAERLEHAVAAAFADGWREVVVIGADTPDLQARHVRAAFAALAASPAPRAASPAPRAVVGPACDGGYYLLALNAWAPHAFAGVALGTPSAFDQTVAALAADGFTVDTLPPLRDVDDGADVVWLARHAGSLRRAESLRRAALALLAPSAYAVARAQLAPDFSHLAIIRPRGPPVLSSTPS